LRRSGVIASVSIAFALIAQGDPAKPIVVWNVSPSVPIGLYLISRHPPVQGQLVAIRLPHTIASLADERGYLPGHALLLKPTAAVGRGRICRWRHLVFVNGILRAHSVDLDGRGWRLPVWTGCVRLTTNEIVVLGRRRDSFDSRYFGPISVGAMLGRAIPIWTFQD
jgi:type IV secretory pathway protease TraF